MSSQPTPSGPLADGAPSPSSSTGSPTADAGGLVADAGPAFDPGAAGDRISAPPPTVTVPTSVKAGDVEDTIRSLLQAKGELLHSFVAVGPKVGVETDEWRYLQDDLDTIAPALARIIARFPAAAEAVASGGDPIAAGLGFLGYGARSIAERQAAIAIAKQGSRPVHVDAAVATPAEAAADAGDDDDQTPPPLAPRGRG